VAPILAQMPRVRWVQSTWAGITPFLAQARRDFVLTGVKEIFGAAMSEYVLGWVLALKRSILIHANSRCWDFRRDPGLAGLRLGIAGTGSIGAEVARRCAPFFADVVGLNSSGRAVSGFSRCFGTGERERFVAGLDVLAMILPDTPGTHRLIGERELQGLAAGAVVINAGRGNALDLPAALAALERGHLSHLVLDVFDTEPVPEEDPIWTMRGVYITSHTAAPTDADAVAQIFLDNLQRFLADAPLRGVIDFDKGY
jgi:phosphoglycerate dehydrogenase-like enzyme